MAARQALAWDAELAVGLAADREDDRVVKPFEVLDLDVVADLDVAEKAEALASRGFLIDADHRLDLRMVGGDATADEAEGGGEAVEEVDLSMDVLALEGDWLEAIIDGGREYLRFGEGGEQGFAECAGWRPSFPPRGSEITPGGWCTDMCTHGCAHSAHRKTGRCRENPASSRLGVVLPWPIARNP